jgi:hypothetical protein
MPGKSRHGKGKHPHYSKKGKIRQHQASSGTPQPAGVSLPQQATANVPKPAAPISASPVPRAATRPEAATIAHYPDIVSELKRIGILTGIIIVILIVLSIVLS